MMAQRMQQLLPLCSRGDAYLAVWIQFQELRLLVVHAKVEWRHLDLDANVLCSNQRLERILVAWICVQLQRHGGAFLQASQVAVPMQASAMCSRPAFRASLRHPLGSQHQGLIWETLSGGGS